MCTTILKPRLLEYESKGECSLPPSLSLSLSLSLGTHLCSLRSLHRHRRGGVFKTAIIAITQCRCSGIGSNGFFAKRSASKRDPFHRPKLLNSERDPGETREANVKRKLEEKKRKIYRAFHFEHERKAWSCGRENLYDKFSIKEGEIKSLSSSLPPGDCRIRQWDAMG